MLRQDPPNVATYRALFLFLLVGVPVLVSLLTPAFVRAGPKAKRAMCANNLRQASLAVLQYMDDRRTLDLTSVPSTHLARTLTTAGYHDNPEGWICPSSDDRPLPYDLGRGREWFWSEGAGSDPPLRESTELSYGFARRRLTVNARANTALGADRALRGHVDEPALPGDVGNHWEGMLVARVDASVAWAQAREGRELTGLQALEARVGDLAKAPKGPPWTPPPEWVWGVLYLGALFWSGYMGFCRPVVFQRTPSPRRLRRSRFLTADVERATGPTSPGAHRSTPAGKPKLTLSPEQRCPYCFDALTPTDDVVACALCRTPFHRGCAREGKRCSSLGCRNARVA